MIPRVYDSQHLHNGNGGFVIDGPTGPWNPDEMAAVVTFVIKQDGNGAGTAVGIGETTLLRRKPNGADFDWSATVTHISGPAFKAGDADVQAWASVAKTGGPGEYDWYVDVTIVNP
jgi:hypothetical protein